MNILKKSIYALSMVGMLGLWACSSEELMDGESRPTGKPVALTISVARDGAGTRTAFTENTQTGGLTDVWVEGDYLHVHNATTGEEVGTLRLIEGANESTAVFSGEVNVDGDGEQELALWYYDNVETNPNLTITTNKYSRKVLTVDLHSQEYASLDELSRMNILNNKVAINVKGTESTVVKDEVMKPAMALARLSLTGLPSGSKGTLEISDLNGYGSNVTTGEEYYNTVNKGTFELKLNSAKPATSTDKAPLKVTNVEVGKDVYIALIPRDKYKFSFKFTNEADGKTYTYDFDQDTNIEAGKYYTSFTKDEGAENGTFSGVQIPMKEEETTETVDHSKNPLAKWAESDLKRSGSGASATGVFTGNYKIAGSYYQFGRNYSFTSYSEVNQNYDKIEVAKMNSNWTGGSFYTSLYGTVNTRTLTNVYNGSGYNEKAKWYTSSTNLSSYPEHFLAAGNSNLANWKGEYIFDSAKQHTQTWAERAKQNGYSNETPCPEGYRLPKLADWKKILPSGGHTYASGKTSSFPTISEIKEDGDIRYAIRWTRVTEGTSSQYLKIDALVIPSTVTSASDVDWTDSNVVTRYFKAAGMIRPFFLLAQFTSQGVISYQWLVKALPQGSLYSTVTSIGAVKVTVSRDDSWLSGFYWVDDMNHYYMEFRFDANNLQEQGSYINVYQPEVPIACNIRCIKE